MALTLKLRSGDIEPLPELTFDAPRIVVGRARGSDLQLPDPSVSLRHASFRERGSEYVLVDEGSENGSYCGELRLARQAPHTLRDGDLVRFGRIWVEVRTGPKSQPAEPSATRELARQLVEQALEQDDQPRGITVTGDGDAGISVRLSRQRHGYVVGSDPKVALRFAELPGRALELRRQGDQVWLRALSEEASARLEGGDTLEVGKRTSWPPGTALLIGARRLSYADVTLQVLEQLERSATERLPDGLAIDPPRGAELASGDEEQEEDEDPSDGVDAGTESSSEAERDADGAPASALPSLASKHAHLGSRFERWTVWDALVYLLALTVLASSVWALRWLSRFGA